MRKKFVHLDFRARDRIEALISREHTQKEVSDILKVDKSTISQVPIGIFFNHGNIVARKEIIALYW